MIQGLGTEIVEVLRIAKLIERHGEGFLGRVYTRRELSFCQTRAQTTQFYAAVWAAKQAILKACGISAHRRLKWNDLEIRPLKHGGARIAMRGSMREAIERCGLGEIRVSLAHCRSIATATAIVLPREI